MQQPRRQAQLQRGGFTLVELLIVIVVIAILAAISVVAYRGVSSNAQAAALKANLAQAAQKLELYRVDNGGYPPDQATLSTLLKPDASTALTYAANNTANPPTYCLTAEQGTQRFSVNSTSRTPSVAACVVNLASDPRATTLYATTPSIPAGKFIFANTSWYGRGANAGTNVVVTGAVDGPVGITSYIRRTWTSVSTTPQQVGFTFTNTSNAAAPITPGQVYTVSYSMRASKSWTVDLSPARLLLTLVFNDASGAEVARVDNPEQGTVIVAGAWTRISATATAPGGAAYVQVTSSTLYIPSAAGWAAGDTLDGTGLMVTQGSTLYNYADGNSPGWAWTGTPNASASMGPPL